MISSCATRIRDNKSAMVLFRAAVLLSIVGSGWQANAQGNPVRDAAAITVFQNSVSAQGGATGWAAIQDWTIAGTVAVNGVQTSTFSWIGAGAEFCLQSNTGSSVNEFLSGHGSPARITNGTVNSLNYFISRASPPFYLPGVAVTQELGNAVLTIQYIGAATTHGVPSIQVHVSDDSDTVGSLVTPHDWFFDATTFMPLEVQFRLPPNENAAGYINGTLDFWQFQAVNALQVPSQTSLTTDSGTTKSYAIGSTAFNSGVPQSTFDPPLGGGQ